jgi:hypothetical protein
MHQQQQQQQQAAGPAAGGGGGLIGRSKSVRACVHIYVHSSLASCLSMCAESKGPIQKLKPPPHRSIDRLIDPLEPNPLNQPNNQPTPFFSIKSNQRSQPTSMAAAAKHTSRDKAVAWAGLYRVRPGLLRLDVAPFALVYSVLWAGALAPFLQPDEEGGGKPLQGGYTGAVVPLWVLVAMPVALLLHVLTHLSTHWAVACDALVAYTKVSICMALHCRIYQLAFFLNISFDVFPRIGGPNPKPT